MVAQTVYVKRRIPSRIAFLLTFVIGLTTPQLKNWDQKGSGTATNTPGNELPSGEIDPTRPFEFLIDADEFDWNGYTIAKEIRKHHEIIPEPNTPHYQTLDIAYIVLKRSGKLIRKFDANVIGEMGQSANFGFYSFLGPGSRQLFISQDTNRGGCQWVVSRPPELRVIFDGHKFGVGREGADLRVEDIDRDGTVEIIVPLTDFYDFQDKMSISEIPLPEIIFKFDAKQNEYLPANPSFKSYLKTDPLKAFYATKDDELSYRSATLNAMTFLIYRGEREQAWQMFDHYYRLPDKGEMQRRIKAILKNQPVYNFIYNNVISSSQTKTCRS